GSDVYYTDRDADEVRAAAGGRRWLRLDVTSPDDLAPARQRVEADAGRLDILVNNAGVNTLAHRVPFDQFPRAEWDRIVAGDLPAVFEVSRTFAPLMRRQRSGRIINIASIVGLVPLRLQCAYVAAKAGVVNLTKSMALELGPDGVLVNGIAPGSTLTEGIRQFVYGKDGLFHEYLQRVVGHVPFGSAD